MHKCLLLALLYTAGEKYIASDLSLAVMPFCVSNGRRMLDELSIPWPS